MSCRQNQYGKQNVPEDRELTLPDCSSGSMPERATVKFGARLFAVRLSWVCKAGNDVISLVRNACSDSAQTGIAEQIGEGHLAIWQDATAEAVAFGLVCCLDNCCQAVIGVSAGG